MSDALYVRLMPAVIRRMLNRRRIHAEIVKAGYRLESFVAPRPYENYEAYVKHQASKLGDREERLRAISKAKDRPARFAAQFGPVIQAAGIGGSVLCLGARLGDEVLGFRQCGLEAIGVDLNPGANNELVEQGDFHALRWPTESFDGVYSNVIDHVLDIHKFMREICRVVKPGGWAYLELAGGYEELPRLDPWGAQIWARNADMVETLQPYVRTWRLDHAEGARRVLVFTPGNGGVA